MVNYAIDVNINMEVLTDNKHFLFEFVRQLEAKDMRIIGDSMRIVGDIIYYTVYVDLPFGHDLIDMPDSCRRKYINRYVGRLTYVIPDSVIVRLDI